MTIKESAYRYLIGSDIMKKEFWKELRVLIIFTLGFTIAFTWRQTIFDAMESLIKFFVDIKSNVTLSVTASTLTTVFCLLLLYFTARYMTRLYERD
jgi:ABC-type spermidine/putrescine transport system permease subunit I